MDLGRWSFRHVGNFLGDVLDGELEVAPSKVVRETFEINDSIEDLDRDLALLRPGSTPEKILNTFSPYFDGGLCLRIENGKTKLTSLFLFGQTFTPPDAKGTLLDLKLTAVETTRVYKTSLAPILRALNLDAFEKLEGASAFAFKATANAIFVLFDNRPHPWQVFAIENAYLSARDVSARMTIGKPTVMSARGFFK